MATTYHIQVTQDDITHGQKGDCQYCPIARAIARTVQYAEEINVYHCDGRIIHSLEPPLTRIAVPFDLPEIAQEFIRRFDHKRTVWPIEFDITVLSTQEYVDAKLHQ
jgi:hypothetical protein